MTPAEYKVLENRLRRAADRQGLALHKSRRRDPRAIDYLSYVLTDTATNVVVLGGHGSPYGLDDVARYLYGEN